MEIEVFDETNNLTEEQESLINDLLYYSAKYLDLTKNTEVSVTLVNNSRIKEINKQYRDKTEATDVISFALDDEHEDDFFNDITMSDTIELPHVLGDLFISLERMKEQAKEYGHSLERELGFLTVHGFLHLNGYDHQTKEDETEMFSLQEKILREYGLTR